MKLGVMQPYFFPNLSHFALIEATEHWVVFDITQYTPKSWMTRNRVLHPSSGWTYISAPLVKSSTSLRICEAQVNDLPTTEQSLLGKLSHYKKTAPYYENVCKLVKDIFSGSEDNNLVSLNISGLQQVCDYLNISLRLDICSDLNLEFERPMGAGDWAPSIASQLSASTYINPWGGHELFKQHDFDAVGVDLQFLQFSAPRYKTPGYEFEPHLSILDTLMWLSPDEVKELCTTNSQFVSLNGEPV